MTDAPDVVVLRRSAHGMDTEEYARELRKRLPDWTVARAATPAEERDLVERAPVVTGHRLPPAVLEAADAMEYFACASAGTGHLPLEALADRGVVVSNGSGVHGPNIAEYVLGQLLVFTRDFHRSWRQHEGREWRHHQSRELKGDTVTIVGLGAIGREVARRLPPFGVETIGVRYTPDKGGPTDEVIGLDHDAFHEALSRTDYLVIASPLTAETRGLVGEAEFETLPSDAVLVNVGRGPIVDTDALVSAVQTNRLRGAALDVTDPEPLPPDHDLWGFDNVSITPHNAGHTPEYYARLAEIVAANLERAAETGDYGTIENRVA
ncbi:D-2-hydroxyacid dehydrogenase [Halorubrum sp. 48-1-W]|uniref:D-2-hydroxyacid dehydrogenase n=1 Tax=Halorubrum sp. 48-1-W TaxID=2249761 RepID=UPI000DCCCA07|nr:D-2-hydroxyacid dehydrogenase [Halorubrum sp. 48-1-W]RAW45860.1 D-2-hydroxyacid dehydrogenase [Halorubrum sp. 48-1-W]